MGSPGKKNSRLGYDDQQGSLIITPSKANELSSEVVLFSDQYYMGLAFLFI